MRLFLLALLTTALFAQKAFYPTQACQAYNNMKHTANSGDIRLELGEAYTVKRHHKGQYLIQLEGANPAQRWVDDVCLSAHKSVQATESGTASPAKKTTVSPSHTQKSKQNLLALSWHNAFCETHRSKQECKRGWGALLGQKRGDNDFVLHGLWPQPRHKVYCGVKRRFITADKYRHWNQLPEPKITQKTKEALRDVMPGVDSNLHRHEWIKHGTCYGTDAQTYFEDAIVLTQTVRHSEVARFFQKNTGKRVTIQRIRELFDRQFGRGAGKHVELRCNRGMITELWLHLGESGDDLSKALQGGKTVYSRCQRGIIDRAGYGR